MSGALLLCLLAAAAAPDVDMREVSEQEWVAGVRHKIAQRFKVVPDEVRVSPGRVRAAFVVDPWNRPGKKPAKRRGPRRCTIVVVGVEGRRQAVFRPFAVRGADEPPRDLQFLGDDRVVYEVAQPPPPEPPARPRRLMVIQPLRRRGRAVRCEGAGFTFTERHDRVAFLVGDPGDEIVSVDGTRVYPRDGSRTRVASDLAWSKDGLALAFLEQVPEQPPRLILIADPDNATGDTTWDLPPTVHTDGLHVFWAGHDKIVVGKTATRPVFATTFSVDRPKLRN
jgi:hypothetical protein